MLELPHVDRNVTKADGSIVGFYALATLWHNYSVTSNES
jgi:hypothetical protein